jgi:hypothetical protein
MRSRADVAWTHEEDARGSKFERRTSTEGLANLRPIRAAIEGIGFAWVKVAAHGGDVTRIDRVEAGRFPSFDGSSRGSGVKRIRRLHIERSRTHPRGSPCQ